MQKEAIFICFDDLEMNVKTLLHVNLKGQGKLFHPNETHTECHIFQQLSFIYSYGYYLLLFQFNNQERQNDVDL